MNLFKTVILVSATLLLVNAAYCQSIEDSFFRNTRQLFLSPTDVNPVVPFKVKSITIIDNRPDTTRLGLYRIGSSGSIQLFLNRAYSLPDFLSRQLTADTATAQLIIVVNSLFISNNIASIAATRQDDVNYNFPSLLTLQAKIYIRKDDYYQGLVKLDTAITVNRNGKISVPLLMDAALEAISAQVQSAITNNVYIKHPKLTAELIGSSNKPSWPEFPESANGYFATFNDFKNGLLTPAKVEYKQFKHKTRFIYITDNDGVETLLRSVWGVKVGSQLYILSNGEPLPLYKFGNGYYWKDILNFLVPNGEIWDLLLENPIGQAFTLMDVAENPNAIKPLPNICALNLQTGLRY